MAAEARDRINVQNNPINFIDPYGLLTGGLGFDISGALIGFGGTVNVQIVKDTKGDTGLAITYGGGGYADLAGISAQTTGGITTANSINDLSGKSTTLGAGASLPFTPGPGAVVTGEAVIADQYVGGYGSVGVGVGVIPIELFGMLTETKVLNFNDLIEKVFHDIFGLPLPEDNMYKDAECK